MPEEIKYNKVYNIHKPATGFWRILRSYFIDPSIDQYIAHLERLKGIEIKSFHHIPMTDELHVVANYLGHEFIIDMAWGGDLDLTADHSVPQNLFDIVVSHMQSYNRVTIKEEKKARKRYIKIAQGNRNKNS